MVENDELRAWLVALRTPGLGPGGLRWWLGRAGQDVRLVPAQLWRHRTELGAAAGAWLRHPDEARLISDQAWLSAPGHRLLRCTDVDFPPQLEHIPQPPAALFVSGEAGVLLYPQVAVVGARAASAGGLVHAERFARGLVRGGFTITSGLADGVDAAAHGAALASGGTTVAVMGTGPDLVYPHKHEALARAIARQGALVSEFPPGTPARADHFPRRNRLIAGLALGALVVEAGMRSGSLITARLAAEQGREVFALPGSIDHALARGCHRLIRDGARLVEEVAEHVELLAPAARMLGAELAARLLASGTGDPPPEPGVPDGAIGAVDHGPGDGPAETAASAAADPTQAALLRHIGHDPVGVDELARRTGWSPAALGAQLLLLELSAQVERLAGDRYRRQAVRTPD
jgi:DNA processing protein